MRVTDFSVTSSSAFLSGLSLISKKSLSRRFWAGASFVCVTGGCSTSLTLARQKKAAHVFFDLGGLEVGRTVCGLERCMVGKRNPK